MGGRTRIRWINVARLAAGAIVCAVLLVGLPSLLERPKPPPLPDDIGLTQAARGPTTSAARSPRAAEPHERNHKPTGPEREPHPDRSEADRDGRHEPERPKPE